MLLEWWWRDVWVYFDSYYNPAASRSRQVGTKYRFFVLEKNILEAKIQHFICIKSQQKD